MTNREQCNAVQVLPQEGYDQSIQWPCQETQIAENKDLAGRNWKLLLILMVGYLIEEGLESGSLPHVSGKIDCYGICLQSA